MLRVLAATVACVILISFAFVAYASVTPDYSPGGWTDAGTVDRHTGCWQHSAGAATVYRCADGSFEQAVR